MYIKKRDAYTFESLRQGVTSAAPVATPFQASDAVLALPATPGGWVGGWVVGGTCVHACACACVGCRDASANSHSYPHSHTHAHLSTCTRDRTPTNTRLCTHAYTQDPRVPPLDSRSRVRIRHHGSSFSTHLSQIKSHRPRVHRYHVSHPHVPQQTKAVDHGFTHCVSHDRCFTYKT